ncbi:MAG: VCBS repeat-containing protein [Planctomycetota bacterium]
MKRTIPALLLVGVTLAGSAYLWAQERRLQPRLWTLHFPATELGLSVADLDGDGRRDLAVAHQTAPRSAARQVSLFLHGPELARRFEPEPTHVLDVPRDACAFAVGDFGPGAGGEVLYVCPTRIAIATREGALSEVGPFDGFFDYPEDAALPEWDLCPDLDRDGIPEVLVPVKDGYVILGRAADGALAERSRIELPAEDRFGPSFETKLLNRFLSSSSRLRRVVVADADGDGRLDLCAYRDEGLAVWLQREDGSFPATPDRERPLALVADQGEGEGSQAFKNVRLELEDLDRDGCADLIATRVQGEIGVFSSLRTQLIVFRGTPDGYAEDKPTTVLNFKGLAIDPEWVDLNGDGKLDAVVSTIRMDMLTNVKRAVLESMTITYHLHLQGQATALAEDPAFSLDMDVPLSALERNGGSRAALFSAELSGDGVRDMIARDPDGGLEIRPGVLEGEGADATIVFDEARPVSLKIYRCLPPRVVDLDGDGRDELLLEPFGGEGPEHRSLRLVAVSE